MTIGELKKALKGPDDSLKIEIGVTALYQEHSTALFQIEGLTQCHDQDNNLSIVIYTPPQDPLIRYNSI